jgi:hypothetical protein
MFKDLLQRGKCLVGIHQGLWLFSADKICTRVQICTICNARTEKPEHNWTEWVLARQDSCDLIRRCSRCEITETKTEHIWRDAEYAGPGACNLQRVCSRCAAAEAAGTRHVMDEWAYISDTGCAQANACSRCAAPGMQRRTEHEWNPPVASAFYGTTVGVCRRCGDMRVPSDSGISLQQAATAVRALMSAADVTGLEAAARQHSAVLSSAATQHYFRLALERFSLKTPIREQFDVASKFAKMCSEAGVEKALAYAKSQMEDTRTAVAATASASSSSATQAGISSSNHRLVGHWRHTEHRGGSGFSMAIDTHLVLGSDGSAVFWNHSAGSFGEQRSAKESGSWHAASGTLDVDAGLRYSGQYQTDGSSLVLPGSGRYRFWTKVR